ncbi:VTT domain-containing protein [Haliscomenobacter hydrossis]|uniref:SNARE associated Golgi protein-like protein n=1 Tax=Haliscomenobacter hydrossis (strain ATCC 27775 / DSM 1100 / LMG 10767 / O) TaxID=760192 RepID=F4L1H1_HALH1|nr:VTT domain-containing protein [Haliscomenobacter hydrossis]AEE53868.1 SNARE associated Golgi protein-like protein [Haliscomenobacter hydrossis DSM 1100]
MFLFIGQLIDFILHIDDHLLEMVNQYGSLVYVVLFIIVFAETGLVVTPILPGDSLLFASGALAAGAQKLDVTLLIILFFVAAVLGNTVNYAIGRYFGPRIFQIKSRWIKMEYLERTKAFYDKYGATAVVLSRFVPIFRSFVPFVAGVGQMAWGKYMAYTIFSAAIWVVPITLLGYWFGNVPIVKENFSLVVLGVIGVSLLPILYQAAKGFFAKKVEEGK